jgi:hypothetical protein
LDTGAADDTDKILVFNPSTGACVDSIDTDGPTGAKAYAQAVVFGPSGYLFAPVRSKVTTTDPAAADVGAIRRYDVTAKTYTDFAGPVTDGGADITQALWFLIFGKTSPVTLAYGG